MKAIYIKCIKDWERHPTIETEGNIPEVIFHNGDCYKIMFQKHTTYVNFFCEDFEYLWQTSINHFKEFFEMISEKEFVKSKTFKRFDL